MKNTSLGYHTIYPYKKLTTKERSLLYNDFANFQKATGEIKIYEKGLRLPPNVTGFFKELYTSPPVFYRMSYHRNDMGLRWDMRRRNYSPGFIRKPPGWLDKPVGYYDNDDKPCSIKAKINPKDLTDVGGLAAATADNLRNVEDVFNKEAARISPLLGELSSYAFSRIDYCFNADVRELQIGCTAEQMMSLIKQADIAHFEEEVAYDNKARRMKPNKNSFRLKSKFVRINCYCKGDQLAKQYPDNPYIEKAHNVIRFEPQCFYSKVYAMSRDIKEKTQCSDSELMYELLSDERCADIIRYYFHKTIGKGDYFTLDGAIEMVHLQKMKDKTKLQLIDALRHVNESRGIPNAKNKLKGEKLESFKHSIWELNSIGINPVTVPRRERFQWRVNELGVKYIPNLLNAYYDALKNGDFPLTAEMKRHLSKYSWEMVADDFHAEGKI